MKIIHMEGEVEGDFVTLEDYFKDLNKVKKELKEMTDDRNAWKQFAIDHYWDF